MRRLQDIGVAKRLGLIVSTGAVLLAALACINLYSQDKLDAQSKVITGLDQGLAALHHLDTRQSELKVDAYRAALGQDVSGDVADDVQSSTEAADAVAAAGLPAGLLATFVGNRPDFVSFGQFISGFVQSAASDPASVHSRLDEIAQRNKVTDDELGALTDKVTAGVQ